MATITETYNEYRNNYIVVHKPPQLEEVVRIQYNFKMFYVILGCIAIFGAFRSGKVIFDASMAEGFATLSYLLSVLGVGGIEGLVISHALFRVRQQQRKYEWVLEWGSVVLGVLMSMTAGAKFSEVYLTGLANDQGSWVTYWINVALSLLFGAGMTLVLWGFGEFIGGLRYAHVWAEQRAQAEYKKNVVIYEDNLTASWEASDERTVAMQDISVARIRASAAADAEGVRAETLRLAADRDRDIQEKQKAYDLLHANRGKGSFVLGGAGSRTRPRSTTGTGGTERGTSLKDIAYEWLLNHPERGAWHNRKDVPAARDIVAEFHDDEKDMALSSAQRAVDKFVEQMEIV